MTTSSVFLHNRHEIVAKCIEIQRVVLKENFISVSHHDCVLKMRVRNLIQIKEGGV
jgi:hypothetical protein